MNTHSLTSVKNKLERKEMFFALPDNVDAFYAYINLIVNNHHNKLVCDPASTPKRFGPVREFSHTRNEVGEPFLIVHCQKDYDFLSRCLHQFSLLRTYWKDIEDLVLYPNSTKYDKPIRHVLDNPTGTHRRMG